MKTLRADFAGFWRYLTTFHGRRIRTFHDQKEFGIHVCKDGVTYTPTSTGKPRPHEKRRIRAIWSRFKKMKSLKKKDYEDLSVNASYTLALIVKQLAERVDGRP